MDGIDYVHGGDARGEGLRIGQATAEEQAAITQLLKERGAEAPGAAPALGTSALMSAGLRLAGVLFVVAGMGGGLGDLVHLHDSGGGPAHHAAVRREEDGQKTESRKGTTDHGPQDYGEKAFPIKLLKQVLDSTVELQAAIEQIFKGQPLPEWRQGAPPPEQPGPSQMPGPRGGFKAFIEGDPASGSFSIRVAPANEASQAPPPKPPEPDQESLSPAARVLQLHTAPDPATRVRKAPPIKVFLLRFRKNLSRFEIARICPCDKSLVALRLKTIQDKLPWKPQQQIGRESC